MDATLGSVSASWKESTVMRSIALVLLAAVTLMAGAEMKMSIEQLKGFVRSSLRNHISDRELADYLHKVHLTNKLDDRTIEEMQGLGAGPKTTAALHDLRDATANLTVAPPPPPKPVYVPPPAPDSVEQKRVLFEATEYARSYSSRMPDFICTQVTRRFRDPKGGDDWRGEDTITERLTYFEHKENYVVSFINSRAVTNVKHEQLGGTTSSGEFASMMEEIFAAKTETEFEWTRWGKLRGRVMHVFSYRVRQANSNYRILAQGAETIVVGYHGMIFVDKEDSRIHKITLEADDIPPSYPIHSAALSLDYDVQRIGDNPYLLPLKSVVTLAADHTLNTKNEVEFHAYRKFTAESTIKDFEPEPIPDSALTEQKTKP